MVKYVSHKLASFLYGHLITVIPRPFIIDIESTNGTFINGDKVPTSRYVELKNGDVVKFGNSTREYVVMCEDAV